MRAVKLLLMFLAIHFSCLLHAQSIQTGKLKADTTDEGIVIGDPVDEMAKFPGGTSALLSFFKNNIVYPSSAIKDGVSGKVHLGFTIQKNGKVKKIKLIKGIREDLNKEALRVVKLMPDWKPAMRSGKPVRQKLLIPIKFTLPAK